MTNGKKKSTSQSDKPDRSAFRQNADNLKDSELILREIFDSKADGILIVDADTGKIIDSNPAAKALTGYSHDDLVGNFNDITLPDSTIIPDNLKISLLEFSQNAIIVTDSNFKIILWNLGAESMYGWRKDEVQNRDVFKLLRTEWPNQKEEEVRRQISKTGEWIGEATHQRKDDTWLSVGISIHVVRDIDGKITAYIGIIHDLTDRSRLLKIIEDETKFPNENPNPVIRISRDGTLIYANPGSKMLIRKWGCTMGGPVPKYLLNVVFETLEKGGEFTEEIDPDGSTFLISVYSGSDDNYVSLYGLDISRLKLLEKSLSESERMYENLAALSPDGIVLHQNGRIEYINEAGERLFGVSNPGDLIGRLIMDFVHPDYRQIVSDRVKNAQQSGNPAPFMDLVFLKDNGDSFPVEVGGVAIERNGETAFLTTIRDLTARRKIEEKLIASEHDFRTLAEGIPQMVWVTGPDGMNTYFNSRWVEYTGLSADESLGQGWITPFHPEDRQKALDAWDQAINEDTTYSIESRLRRADGVYHWWLIRGIPAKNQDGTIKKWFGTCTDIEKLKNTESILIEKVSELERWYSVTLGRETRISELKREVNNLLGEMNKPKRYASVLPQD